MKTLICGLVTTVGMLGTFATAEQMLNVDGKEYALSVLMADCQNIANDPAGQMACFSDLSKRIEQQAAEANEPVLSVPEALQAFQTAAQYIDADTGLAIAGSECIIQITYFSNYFHLSRRNISSIDLFSAQFDVSRMQYDKISEIRGAQVPLVKGVMEVGANAVTWGGLALESTQNNFAPRGPATALDVYANEVVAQLAPRQNPEFEFVLVHPQRSQAGAEIWAAFEGYVKACKK